MSARYSSGSGYTVKRRTPVKRPTVQKTPSAFKLGPNTAKFLGLALLAILAAVMITQSSGSATTAYQQSDVRSSISETDQQVQDMQLQADRDQSLQNAENTPVKSQMQQTTQVNQVQTGDVAGASTQRP